MMDTLRIFLGQRWAGLAIALLLLSVGYALIWCVGIVALAPGGLLLFCTIFALATENRAKPPGKIIRIDGVSMHILAEGGANGKLPVIWVSGGHGEGLVLHHLHKQMREKTRSIIFDRTGSGWSDPARRPVRIGDEIRRLNRLLEAAGEKGPFVLAGHSFGGLFAANYAQAYPQKVACLVLLDPTRPWNVAYAGHLTFPPIIKRAWRGALASHFGLRRFVEPEIDDPDSPLARELADVANIVNSHSVAPKSLLAEASVFQSSMTNPFDLVVGRGALGDIPLVLMTPHESEEDKATLEKVVRETLKLDDRQMANFLDGQRDATSALLELSSRSRHIILPEGTTHMFPYEVPARVIDEVSGLI